VIILTLAGRLVTLWPILVVGRVVVVVDDTDDLAVVVVLGVVVVVALIVVVVLGVVVVVALIVVVVLTVVVVAADASEMAKKAGLASAATTASRMTMRCPSVSTLTDLTSWVPTDRLDRDRLLLSSPSAWLTG
jgi:hypothetical protein